MTQDQHDDIFAEGVDEPPEEATDVPIETAQRVRDPEHPNRQTVKEPAP